MTATARTRLPVLMGRAWLLAGILAVVAGILGMHGMSGNHGAHMLGAAAPPSSVAAPVRVAHGGVAPVGVPPGTTTPGNMAPVRGHIHGGHAQAGHAQAGGSQAVNSGPDASAAACTGGGAGLGLTGAACTPSAKAASLVAPTPGSAGQPADAPIGSGLAALRSYTYLPAGPSPGDLSISRT
jgi:hypothetical protein